MYHGKYTVMLNFRREDKGEGELWKERSGHRLKEDAEVAKEMDKDIEIRKEVGEE